MILEELGRNPPDVTLGHIVKDLLSFFNGFQYLHEAKRVIEKKCDIKKEPEHKCWSEDYIKRAWEETKRIDRKSVTRRYWARVIILQVVKSFVCDTCKQNAAQKNRDPTTDEQCCDMRRNPEDRSSQSEAELETVGAAGGDEQMFGAGKKLSEVSKLTESDSGVASESQLSASSTDVAPSPTEVNPIANSSNSESKNAALVNKNEDTLVNNCEQQKYVVNYELCLADVHDKENVRRKNGIRSVCGISQRMKANSEDRSTQSNAEPQQTEQTKDTAEQQSGADSGATKRKCTDNAGSESLLSTSGERDDSKEVPKRRSLTRGDDGEWVREGSNKSNSQTVYIRIPFSVMAGNESPSSTDTKVTNDHPTYKLIDRVPYLTEIRKRKSYAMLYDNRTRNAAWVYEILNSETLKEEVERKNVFSVDQSIHPFYQTSNGLYQDPYVRGHLAAAANHRWCREACDDTFLMSNISPQHEGLNIGLWNSLERECRSKAKDNQNDIRNVHVYSGPLYLPRENNSNVTYAMLGDKAVPTHFFKVIIVEHNGGTVELECYKMPNERLQDNRSSDNYQMPNQRLIESYSVTIEEIERDSGLIFRENSCREGETDMGLSLRKVTWTGKIEYDEPCRVTTHVNISTPCT